MSVSNRYLTRVAVSCLAVLVLLLWWAQLDVQRGESDFALVAYELEFSEESLPEFLEYPAGPVRKEIFTDYLVPLIQQVNAHVLMVRESALAVAQLERKLSKAERQWLAGLCELYRVEADCQPSAVLADELALRINAVPVALAVAQGAKESGWGTSRFAREGNNLFGHWCFEAGCGLIPKFRNAGATHEVAVFDAPAEAIEAYIENINSHQAYAEVRLQRSDQGLDPQAMALGLSRYSERGQAYVDEVQKMMRQNPSWLEFPITAISSPSAD
ncbi:glucosaminidase domain-containing protein [Neiella marina]|uniref:Glucosaminidase domain-containing protein n=1 Tax=Neiella holothuriorum TaxID=2870530 RepID=A0ABS7EC96_9GAMM|nr:glucosaminidase domain-containing protein [Neiella holothuriorum]MBW8189870.1 glucosaminidase domain-containing protein [Neiella holothuriorum]